MPGRTTGDARRRLPGHPIALRRKVSTKPCGGRRARSALPLSPPDLSRFPDPANATGHRLFSLAGGPAGTLESLTLATSVPEASTRRAEWVGGYQLEAEQAESIAVWLLYCSRWRVQRGRARPAGAAEARGRGAAAPLSRLPVAKALPLPVRCHWQSRRPMPRLRGLPMGVSGPLSARARARGPRCDCPQNIGGIPRVKCNASRLSSPRRPGRTAPTHMGARSRRSGPGRSPSARASPAVSSAFGMAGFLA